MRIILDGRKVGNGDIAVYFKNEAYFKKRGLNKRTVLHELCHHIAHVNGLEQPQKEEEKRADSYARRLAKRFV